MTTPLAFLPLFGSGVDAAVQFVSARPGVHQGADIYEDDNQENRTNYNPESEHGYTSSLRGNGRVAQRLAPPLERASSDPLPKGGGERKAIRQSLAAYGRERR